MAKLVQFLEIGNLPKSQLDPCRLKKVMTKNQIFVISHPRTMQKIRRADFNIDLETIKPISTGFCTEKHTFFKKHRREWGAPKIFIEAFPAVCPMLLENTVAYANRDGCMRKSTSKYTRFMKKVPRFPSIEFFFRTKTRFHTSKNVRFSSTFFFEFLRHTQARCRAW